jgi:multisubunit Na+/H+ antiporter MnhG subunit
MSLRDAATWVLLGAGGCVQVLALLGTVLLRDALERLHYLGATSVAALLLGAAVVVRFSFSLIGIRAILLAAFLVATGPVLAHVTARAILVASERDG